MRRNSVQRPLGLVKLRDDELAHVVESLELLVARNLSAYTISLYVGNSFPGDLDAHPISVRPVSKFEPLFFEESSYQWRSIRLGLGWSGSE